MCDLEFIFMSGAMMCDSNLPLLCYLLTSYCYLFLHHTDILMSSIMSICEMNAIPYFSHYKEVCLFWYISFMFNLFSECSTLLMTSTHNVNGREKLRLLTVLVMIKWGNKRERKHMHTVEDGRKGIGLSTMGKLLVSWKIACIDIMSRKGLGNLLV